LAILFQAAISRTFQKKEPIDGKMMIGERRWRYVRYNQKVSDCLNNEILQSTASRDLFDKEVETSMFDFMDSESTPGQLRNRTSLIL
jgi:hypothetical protein